MGNKMLYEFVLESSKPSLFQESLKFTRSWPTNLSSLGGLDCPSFWEKSEFSLISKWAAMGFLWREKNFPKPHRGNQHFATNLTEANDSPVTAGL